MKTSEQGLRILIDREAKRCVAYRDSKGYWTIGVGHLLSTDTNADYSGLVWTDAQVEAAFAKDIASFEQAVNDAINITPPLEQHQFDALVSFSFNVGVGAFMSSTLVKKINKGDLAGAALEFDRWHIPAEITARRNGEREQFKGTAFEPRIHEDTVA